MIVLSFSGQLNLMEYKSLLPEPEVTLIEGDDRVCISCQLNYSIFNACVAVVHSTPVSMEFEQQLHVYSINKSKVFNCFPVSGEELNIAVFGLLHNGLERIPAYTNSIKNLPGNRNSHTTHINFIIAILTTTLFLCSVRKQYGCKSADFWSIPHCYIVRYNC